MKRTLINQGGGGFTVYLPKKWVIGCGLTGGDQVEIEERGRSLSISSGPGKRREAKITLTPENRGDLAVLMTHLYRRGIDSILISNADEKDKEEAKIVTRDLLLGFDVFDNGPRSVKAVSISEPRSENHDAIFLRLFLIIKETINDLSVQAKNGRVKDTRAIEALKKDHDRYILFCKRVVVRGDLGDLATTWELLTFLMHIEHCLFYLGRFCHENKVAMTPRVKEGLETAGKYFELYSDAYSCADIKKIHKINELKSKYQFGWCYKIIAASRGDESVALSLIREAMRLIQVGSSPILSGIIEKEAGQAYLN